ncbi:unnamed protein product [Urochloa decumbens]|uniref:TF-B3 domain-containing protein n=1 Tax=Urochloa decumbens TaxID=240449 RepID=A0ABC8YTL7_9POAL
MASGAEGSEVTIAAVASEVAASADMGVVVASPEHADLPAMDPINDDQSDVSDADLAAGEAMAAHQAPGSPAAPGLPAALPFREIRNPVFPDYNRRTFLLFFKGHFMDQMDCPPGFAFSFLGDVLPSARILDFEVGTDIVNGCIRFSRGWRAFVEAERIVAGEAALFLLVAPNTFAVRMFGTDWSGRPLVSNPSVIWNLLWNFNLHFNAPAAP